ncbi:hypothetical protein BH11PSE11_BH11PSE11_08640 [soil metagenome]
MAQHDTGVGKLRALCSASAPNSPQQSGKIEEDLLFAARAHPPEITIRAARAQDAAMLQDLVRGLSLQSRYRRFFHALRELPGEMLASFTHAHPNHEVSLLALVHMNGREVAVGMAQYFVKDFPQHCEFAIVVTDQWQRLSIGKRLLRELICIARAAGIERIEGDVLNDNQPVLHMLDAMGFTIGSHPDESYLLRAWKPLTAPAWKCASLPAMVSGNALRY